MISGDNMMFSVPDHGSVMLSHSVMQATIRQQDHGTGRRAGVDRRASAPFQPKGFDPRVRYDATVSEQMQREYLANLAKNAGPKAADTFAAYFRTHPVHSQFDIAAGPYGLRRDNLVDVTTAYFVVMWTAANQAALPTRAQVDGVRQQFLHGMGAVKDFPDAMERRQQVAEMMMYKLVAMILLREEAQRANNQAVLQQLADSAPAAASTGTGHAAP